MEELLLDIVVDVGTASEQDVEESGGRRKDAYPNIGAD